MHIAIPSHRRAETLKNHTMATLERQTGFREEDVRIFLSDQEDFLEYQKVFGKKYKMIVTGANSLAEKLNYIEDYYGTGDWVMVIEDDIEQFVWGDGSQKIEDVNFVIKEFARLFRLASLHKVHLVGIYPAQNYFFCKNRISTGLKFIVANCYGFIVNKRPHCKVQHSCKNDYERTLRYYDLDNTTIRADYIHPVTKNYKNEGGIDKDGRKEAEEKACHFISENWGHLAKIKTRAGSPYPEITLKKQ